MTYTSSLLPNITEIAPLNSLAGCALEWLVGPSPLLLLWLC